MDGIPWFHWRAASPPRDLAQAGSRDLRLRFFAEEQQMFFAPKRGAYQLDHVFGDGETEARVRDWRVDTGPVTSTPTLSDDASIWVELA